MREIIFIAQNTFSSYGYDRSPKMSNFWSSGISLKINLMRERERERIFIAHNTFSSYGYEISPKN